MITYAQNFEDVLLERCFQGVSRGLYIDVGAWDPIRDSVTKHFYDKGWTGINIEPHPVQFSLIESARPRDINLNVALGESDGEMPFYEASESGLSTASQEQVSRLSTEHGISFSQISVRVTTLTSVCEQYVGARQIDFLKVDVEGYERQVLQGNDWTRWRPRVVVVEATMPYSTVPSWGAWEEILLSRGYIFAQFDGLNRYFVRSEDFSLVPVLSTPANCSDTFVSYRLIEAENKVSELGTHIAKLSDELSQVKERLVETEASLHQVSAHASAAEAAHLAYVAGLRDDFDSTRHSLLETIRTTTEELNEARDLVKSYRLTAAELRTRARKALRVHRRGLVALQSQHADENRTYERRLEVLQSEITALQGQFEETQAVSRNRLLSLERNLSDRERQMNALLSSHSWRITRPLRELGDRIKRLHARPGVRVQTRVVADTVAIVGRLTTSNGIGLKTIAFLECLADIPTVFVDTRPHESSMTDLPRSLVARLRAWEVSDRPTVSIFTDVLWNGADDTNYLKLPMSSIHIAYTMFDSDRIPDEWASIINSRFDAAVVPDSYMADIYRSSGVTKPVFSLPMSISTALDPLLRRPLRNFRHTPFVFGCVASFSRRKNIKLLIDAFHEAFPASNSECVLHVHSNLNFSNAYQEMVAHVERLGATNIILTCRNLTRDEYGTLLESFDYYVLLSMGEGFSITPREALALGLPVILSSINAHRILSDEGMALPIPAETPVLAFYEAIDERSVGYQYTCSHDDVVRTLAAAYAEYNTLLEGAELRRDWTRKYTRESLHGRYETLVAPDVITLSDYESIEDKRLVTSSVPLIRKYLGLPCTQRQRRGQTIVVPAHDGGFYSIFNRFMSHLVWGIESGADAVLPDWSVQSLRKYGSGNAFTSWCYGRESDGNVWNCLFEPIAHRGAPTLESVHTLQEMYADAIVRNDFNEQHEPLLTYVNAYRLYRMPDFQHWREWYHEYYTNFVHPLPKISRRVESIVQQHFGDNYILGAHVRHPSHAIEQPDGTLPSFERYARILHDSIAKLPPGLKKKYKVFLATDSDLAVQYFQDQFGDNLVTLRDVARTTVEQDVAFLQLPVAEQMKEGYQIQHRHASNESKWSTRLAEDVIADAMVLAHCHILLHSTSNVATAVSFMNPKVRMIQCDE